MRRYITLGLVAWWIAVVGTIGSEQLAEAKEDKQEVSTSSPYPTMTEEEMKAFLGQPLIARLATVRANGTPQLVPMWFLYEDGLIHMST